MTVQTNISVTPTQKEYYQRFVNLSVNEKALPQGDGTIRISPFDDYFIFTIFDEIDNEDTPIDLSNVGDIYLSFIGNNDEIVIKNHTQVEEVDLSQGEVLFRITKSDSKKVLALNNNNFYVSTKMISPEDGSVSDESILYPGIWLAYSDATRTALTVQLEELQLEYSKLLGDLEDENTQLKNDNQELVNSAGQDDLVIQGLQNNNSSLINEITELSEQIKSNELAALQRASLAANAAANKQAQSRQQIKALVRGAKSAQTGSTEASYFKQAADNLENYTI